MSKVGFVILTWNSEKYIEACLNSILAIGRFEVFISCFDNGSKDSTKALLQSFEEKYSNVVVSFADENLGTTKSRNIAIGKLPETDFICVLDSDTEIKDVDGFCNMMTELEKDCSIGIIGPRLYGANGEMQYSGRNIISFKDKLLKVLPIKRISESIERKEYIDYDAIEGDLVDVGYLMSACMLFKRSLIDEIGLFDEKIFYAPEDIEFCSRCEINGLRVVYYKGCQVLHYWQRLSRKKLFSKHNFEHLKGLLYFYRKYKRLNKIKTK